MRFLWITHLAWNPSLGVQVMETRRRRTRYFSSRKFRASRENTWVLGREASTFPLTVGNIWQIRRLPWWTGKVGIYQNISPLSAGINFCTVRAFRFHVCEKNNAQFTKIKCCNAFFINKLGNVHLTLNLIQSVYIFYLIDRFNHVVMPCASHHYYDNNTMALSTTSPLRSFG